MKTSKCPHKNRIPTMSISECSRSLGPGKQAAVFPQLLQQKMVSTPSSIVELALVMPMLAAWAQTLPFMLSSGSQWFQGGTLDSTQSWQEAMPRAPGEAPLYSQPLGYSEDTVNKGLSLTKGIQGVNYRRSPSQDHPNASRQHSIHLWYSLIS